MARYLGFDAIYIGDEYYFVSYSSADQNRIIPIAKAMHSINIPMWYDNGLIHGENWRKQLAQRIGNSAGVIFFVSEDLLEKDKSYVQKEYTIATEVKEKNVYIVMLDKINPTKVSDTLCDFWTEIRDIQSVKAYQYVDGEGILDVNAMAQAIKDMIGKKEHYVLSESVVKLKNEIETSFHVKYDFKNQNCTDLAKTLCDREVYSLSKDMKEIVYFLIMNCSDFNFESPYLASLICGSLEQLQEQKDAFIKYIDEKSITLGMFIRLTIESIKEYEIYFEGVPLEGQCEKLMQSILNWGDTAKSIADIQKGLEDLDLFDISEKEKWKFVCDNASVFFNDFSRDFAYKFEKLIEKYGKDVAFEKLKGYPEYLRWGRLF